MANLHNLHLGAKVQIKTSSVRVESIYRIISNTNNARGGDSQIFLKPVFIVYTAKCMIITIAFTT